MGNCLFREPAHVTAVLKPYILQSHSIDGQGGRFSRGVPITFGNGKAYFEISQKGNEDIDRLSFLR